MRFSPLSPLPPSGASILAAGSLTATATTAARVHASRTGDGMADRLHPDDIAAIADAVFEKLKRRNTERRRRRRSPCGRGSSVPVCMGSAVYGPEGCTCLT
jgi:hypothetical protein